MKSLTVTLLLLFISHISGLAQAKNVSPEIRKELLLVFEKVKNLNLRTDSNCIIDKKWNVQQSLDMASQSDLNGNWKCCATILSSLSQQQDRFSAKEKVEFLLARAAYFNSRQIYDSVKLLAQMANVEAGKNEWITEKINALLLLSYSGLKTRNISYAYASADSALQFSRKDHNRLLEGQALLQMGLCARRHFTSFSHRAFPYYLQAMDVATANGDSATLFTACIYYADDNFEIDQWAEGLPYLEKAVDIALQSNGVSQAFKLYVGVGYPLSELYYSNEATLLFRKGEDLAKQQQQPYNVEGVLSFIADQFQNKQQYDSAMFYNNLAAAVPGINPFWANQWEKKAVLYKLMGNYKMASDMYEKAIDWYTEDFLYRNQDQLSNYEATLNTKEKELQVGLEKKRSIQLEWIIGGAMLLLFFVIFALIVQRKARKKLLTQNNIIEKQRSELENSLDEKEMLLKEIHHRVKNNLSVIGSLLELQSSNMEDEKAKAAILEGQNRVRSIALIHQRLYQHENLAAIEFGGFVEDMIREVSGIFKKPGQRINTDLKVPHTLLDIDTAVPLGLIMNELLTNSFKYAFSENKEGWIRIKMNFIADGNYILYYSDNGPGMPADFDLKKSRSLGLRLIYRLSNQIGGRAEYTSEEGCMFVIRFKNALTRNKEA
ncbi:MAG: sensor histidine kinase [Ferruginibacter sp.]